MMESVIFYIFLISSCYAMIFNCKLTLQGGRAFNPIKDGGLFNTPLPKISSKSASPTLKNWVKMGFNTFPTPCRSEKNPAANMDTVGFNWAGAASPPFTHPCLTQSTQFGWL